MGMPRQYWIYPLFGPKKRLPILLAALAGDLQNISKGAKKRVLSSNLAPAPPKSDVTSRWCPFYNLLQQTVPFVLSRSGKDPTVQSSVQGSRWLSLQTIYYFNCCWFRKKWGLLNLRVCGHFWIRIWSGSWWLFSSSWPPCSSSFWPRTISSEEGESLKASLTMLTSSACCPLPPLPVRMDPKKKV